MVGSFGKFLDLLLIALDSISHRKTRSFLTMLGIFIGVASVVAIISLGQGLSESVNAEFRKIGTDKLVVQPGAGPFAGFSATLLTDRDLDAVRRVSGVESAGYMITRSLQVSHGDRKLFIRATAIPASAQDAGPIEEFYDIAAEKGRLLEPNDNFKLLVGNQLAYGGVFGHDIKLNDVVAVNDTEFRVAGILKKTGNPTVDGSVFLPGDTAKRVFGTNEYNAFVLKLQKGLVPSEQVASVEKALRQSRGMQRDKEDFRVQTSEQILSSFNTIFGVINVIVIGIAAISLLVGAVGIMNTMYTAVLERTQEIGIMKAVGAKNSEILLLFLIESGLLGLVGGVVGVVLGFFMAKGAEIIANQALGNMLISVYFPPQLVLGALLFSLVFGSISGAYPARQASHLRPVDALRYE